MDLEVLRGNFRPNTVRVLLVGESPPQGGTFFFAGDSRLFVATRAAFECSLGAAFSSAAAFLGHFKEHGFYLEDLCAKPVNSLGLCDRRIRRREAIPRLTAKLRAHRPQALITIMKAIQPHVALACRQAGLAHMRVYALPFPAYQHVAEYKTGLVEILREVRLAGIVSGAAESSH